MSRAMRASLIALVILMAAAPAWAAHVPKASPKSEEWAKAWMKDLHEMGIRMEGDSLRVSDTARRVMTDAAYRKAVYPEVYRWEAVKKLIEAKQMKIAFWYLINLYEAGGKYRDPALKMLLALDGPLEMDRVLLSTYYTYGLVDPRVCSFEDGHPVVHRPDLAEKRLGVVKEILAKVAIHRKSNPQKAGASAVGARVGGGR